LAATLRPGSIKIRFAERPLHDLHPFMIKFARLKCLCDCATHAAAQRASEIQKMKFDISIQSSIVVFLFLAAGTITSLRGISLTSEFPVDGGFVVIVDSGSRKRGMKIHLILPVQLIPRYRPGDFAGPPSRVCTGKGTGHVTPRGNKLASACYRKAVGSALDTVIVDF